MNIPIKFPSQVEVIAEEAARFRALSPIEQVRSLNEMFRLHQFLLNSSGREAELTAAAEAEKELERAAIREFIADHG